MRMKQPLIIPSLVSMMTMLVGYGLAWFILQTQLFGFNPRRWQYWLSGSLAVVAFLQAVGVVGSIVLQKRYRLALCQGLVVLAVSGLFAIASVFIVGNADFFATDLSIPSNIDFALPIQNPPCKGDCEQYEPNFATHTAALPSHVTEPTLFLYDGIQGGIYSYEVYLGNIEKGTVYLKAFEITHNTPLSADRLAKDSQIVVDNPTTKPKKFRLAGDFTIYEGDWYQYYGSCFELWFRPDPTAPHNAKKNRGERKLLSKNFIIQGWQR